MKRKKVGFENKGKGGGGREGKKEQGITTGSTVSATFNRGQLKLTLRLAPPPLPILYAYDPISLLFLLLYFLPFFMFSNSLI